MCKVFRRGLTRRGSTGDWLAVGALTLVMAVVSTAPLSSTGIWLDEALDLRRGGGARRPIPLDLAVNGGNMTLHIVLMRFWLIARERPSSGSVSRRRYSRRCRSRCSSSWLDVSPGGGPRWMATVLVTDRGAARPVRLRSAFVCRCSSCSSSARGWPLLRVVGGHRPPSDLRDPGRAGRSTPTSWPSCSSSLSSCGWPGRSPAVSVCALGLLVLAGAEPQLMLAFGPQANGPTWVPPVSLDGLRSRPGLPHRARRATAGCGSS